MLHSKNTNKHNLKQATYFAKKGRTFGYLMHVENPYLQKKIQTLT